MPNNDKYTKETDKRFTLRIDKEIFAKIKEKAQIGRRAIGRQIEFMLEQALLKK